MTTPSTPRFRGVLLSALWSAGCGGAPVELDDCQDPACREAWVIEHWVDEPDRVVTAVAAIEDPVVQGSLVIALSEAYPAGTEQLCAVLGNRRDQIRCSELNRRSHLRVEVPKRPGGGASSTGSPDDDARTFQDFALLTPMPARMANGPVATLDCRSEPSENTCRGHRAKMEADAGNLEGVAEVCRTASDARWRGECYFQAADQSTSRGRSGGLTPAGAELGIALCAEAGVYQDRCLTHLLGAVAQAAPALDATTGDWSVVTASLNAAVSAIAEREPRLSAPFADRVWAELMFHSAASTGSGAIVLPELPPAALPHLRAAVAWRVFQASSPPPRDLGVARAQIAAILAGDAAVPGQPLDLNAGGHKMRRLWRAVLPGEQDLPWAHLYRGDRRTVSDDPTTDLDICVLEAAARAAPPAFDVLDDGMSHDDERVRWTAARLLTKLDTRPHGKSVADDPSALVRGRLK